MSVKKSVLLSSLSALFAAGLVACGGDVAPPQVVAQDAVVPVTATTVAAAVALPPVTLSSGFSGAVSSTGIPASSAPVVPVTTGPTTLDFGGTAAAPTFSIAAEGKTATGKVQFGSCIFVVETSSFVDPHPLSPGKTVRVNPCSIKVDVGGVAADNTARATAVQVTLGTATSVTVQTQVAVDPNGSLTISGASGGTVTLTNGTGG